MVTRLVCRGGRLFLLAALLLALGSSPLAGAAPARQGEPVLLVYGQTVDGRLDGSQPSLFYAFDAQAGDLVTITMIVTGGDLDPFLVLSDADQTPLITDDNSGGGTNARLSYAILAAGRYGIQATFAGGEATEEGGTFSLNLTAATDGEAIPPAEATPATGLSSLQAGPARLAALGSQATVRDTLDREVPFRLYWFEAAAGESVSFSPEQLADFQPLLVLYDAAFAELARTEPGTTLQATVDAAGLYFLVVTLPNSGSAGGEYGLTVNQSSTAEAPAEYTEIAYGQSISAGLDQSIPAITYRFTGSQDDIVTITMARTSGDLDSYLYLMDGAGQLLYEDNDSGGANGDARIQYTLPADGPYLIIATRLGQAQGTTSGSFQLDLTSNAAAPTEAAPAEAVLPADYQGLPTIGYGETVEGQLSDARFMDVYVFKGAEGDAISIDLTSTEPDAANALDPMLVLLDDGRIPLVENDDIVDGQIRDSHLEYTLPRSAYYAIVATRFDQDKGTSAGPYALKLTGPGGEAAAEATPAPAEALPSMLDQLNAAPLEPGTPAQGTFDTAAKLYTLSASAGALVDLVATTDSGSESVVILADQNLNEVLSSTAGSLTGLRIPSDGEYLVILAPRFGPVDTLGGGYILALTQASTAGGGEGSGLLSYGQTVSGTIDDDHSSQSYTFSGKAGETVEITMEAAEGSTLDCYLELQDSAGTVLDANDDIDPGVIRDSQITASLPADGDYVILASRYVGPDAEITSGAYQLTINRTEEGAGQGGPAALLNPTTTPVSYGETLVGELNDEQYLLFYVFEGAAGDLVTITIEHLSGNLDTVLYLYQAAGTSWTEIATNDDSPTGGTYEPLISNFALPQSGKYLIAVARYGLETENYAGSFAITLDRAQ